MINTVAILTEKGVLSNGIKEDTEVNIFKVENNKVYGYENIKLKDNDKEKFSQLLKIKEVTVVYIDSLTNDLKWLFSKLGIKEKCKEDWSEDEFIHQFVFG